ncbi:MAG: 3-dehydroquinate synthase [Candidatus Dadabacteria bacterium]|nr:MAG: 3-dehydroquinate synthase [Candidatus Dadabacteria bacterium]
MSDVSPVIELSGDTRWRHGVWVGQGVAGDTSLWRTLLADRAAVTVVTDTHLADTQLAAVLGALPQAPATVVTVPAGEASKSRQQKQHIETEWFRAGLGRDAVCIALGGGVIGDLAGFCAATYLRGIPVIQVPTSVVAMVDSSIGGKTGIDVPEGKNLIGAFHPPRAVIADVDMLATLPQDQLRYGLAEVVKHGFIADATLLDLVEQRVGDILAADPGVWTELVERNVRIKGDVVMRDEREGGLRQILNFGHTIGHALELLYDYQLPHGAGVALGMVAEAAIAVELREFPLEGLERLRRLCGLLGLPTQLDRRIDAQAALDATRSDKKVRAGTVRYALPNGVGRFDPDPEHGYAIPVDDALVVRALEEIQPNG